MIELENGDPWPTVTEGPTVEASTEYYILTATIP
jgi:hypothetical protein